MNWKYYLFVVVIVCVAFGQIDAQENYNISSISQYYHNWSDGVIDVCVRGDYAYLACNGEGLRIEDISNPGWIQDVGQYAISDSNHDYATAVAVSGGYALLGYFDNGIIVIDISNKASPQEINRIPMAAGTKNAIRIAGDYAFICSYGLTIIDISDPANSQVIWRSEDSFEVDDIEMHGDTAYVAFGEHGLKVMDISQITSPQPIASFSFEDGTWVSSASISGDYAYMACGGRGLQVLNLKTMQIVAGIDSLSYAFRVKVRDSYAYMAYGDPECPLAIVDISNPFQPQTMGIYYPPQDIVNFDFDGDLVYVADYLYGLRMVDVSEPQNPHEEYVYSPYGHDIDIAVHDNYAFVREEFKIVIVNIDDLHSPQAVTYFEYASEITNMRLVGSIAYTSHLAMNCLNAIDISDPLSPTLLGSFIVEHDVHYRTAIYDHYAYLLENDGLRIVDITDPAAMSQAGFFQTSVCPSLLDIFDHYAVVQNSGQQLVVLDLSNPILPSIIGRYNMGQGQYCYHAKEADGRLYVTSQHKLWIFDISNPYQWAQLSATTIFDGTRSYLNGIDLVNGFAYLAVSPNGLCVFDVTDGANPRNVGLYRTPGLPLAVVAVGNIAVVADYTNLGFYDCSQAVGVDESSNPPTPVAFALLPNYPNPFNSSTTIQFELLKPGHVLMTVFDILGRSISTLANKEFAAGRHTINWNGTATDGKAVASGRYFVRATNGEAIQNMPVLLLK